MNGEWRVGRWLHFSAILIVHRPLPVVYFSANTQVEQLSVEAGAKYFIQKPININDLEAIIQKALTDQRSR